MFVKSSTHSNVSVADNHKWRILAHSVEWNVEAFEMQC